MILVMLCWQSYKSAAFLQLLALIAISKRDALAVLKAQGDRGRNNNNKMCIIQTNMSFLCICIEIDHAS